jgi:hypothetical protein
VEQLVSNFLPMMPYATQAVVMDASMRPPFLEVSTNKIYVNTTFALTFAVGARWRLERGLTAEDIWRAGLAAETVLETSPTTLVPSCRKCSTAGRRVLELGLTGKADFGPFTSPDQPGIERFRFDMCRAWCTSSRLHLGSRVVVAMRLPFYSPLRPLLSPPIDLLSKKPLRYRSAAAQHERRGAGAASSGAGGGTGTGTGSPVVVDDPQASPYARL